MFRKSHLIVAVVSIAVGIILAVTYYHNERAKKPHLVLDEPKDFNCIQDFNLFLKIAQEVNESYELGLACGERLVDCYDPANVRRKFRGHRRAPRHRADSPSSRRLGDVRSGRIERRRLRRRRADAVVGRRG